MAVYYVSQKNGDDSNNGLSHDNAWLTITKACQTLVAGDIVYVASGNYKEKPNNVNSGVEGNLIEFIADTDSSFFPNESIGDVIVTGEDDNGYATSGIVWTCERDYVSIIGFIVHGSSDNYAMYRGNGTGRINTDCHFISNRGVYYGMNINCTLIGGYYGSYYGNHNNCVIIGGTYGSRYGTSNNCVIIGGTYGSRYGTSANCVVIGGNYGFRDEINNNCTVIGGYYSVRSSTSTNSIVIGGTYGFYYGTSVNCIAMFCQNAYNSLTANNCRYLCCNTTSSGTIVGNGLVESKNYTPLIRSFTDMAKAFDFDYLGGIEQWADDTVDVGVIDILGKARRMVSGALDVGAYARIDEEIEYEEVYGSEPSLKIKRKGQHIFFIPCKKDELVTISIQTKHTNTFGEKPQIILRGQTISEQVATHTSGDNTWEKLTVSATPYKNEELELLCFSRDTSEGSVSYFSDIEVI